MSTPPPKVLFQTVIDPELLKSYNLLASASSQSTSFPTIFLDSLTVRDIVFVQEQKAVPRKHHLDRDDARSCCMVLYAFETEPIGTIRIVPSPHHPHPTPGARFEAPREQTPCVPAAELFSIALPEYVEDRATGLHDDVEPYVKLGRLCVVAQHRGKRYADLLIQYMLMWVTANRGFACGGNGREWKGLVCVHANVKALGTWQRNRFVVDEEMGTWFEAGLPHVGMFLRLKLEDQ